jgi:hypothetical protein
MNYVVDYVFFSKKTNLPYVSQQLNSNEWKQNFQIA